MQSANQVANAGTVIARALVPVIGVAFLGWSAPKLLIIYLADTAAAYYAFLAPLAVARDAARRVAATRNMPAVPADVSRTARVAAFGPLPTLLLVGLFFGVLPLFVMIEMQEVWWRDLLADRTLWAAVVLQFALALGLNLRRALGQKGTGIDARPAPLLGTFIATRWVAVVLIGFFMGGIPRVIYGPLLVATYATISAAIELAPQTVLAWAMRVVGKPQVPRR